MPVRSRPDREPARPALIRSCRVASVSSGRTGTTSWARMGPASISRVAMWTVHPVSVTPAARASRTPCQPGKAGSRDGWVFRIRPGNAWCTASVMTVPKPAIATRSTWWATRTEATVAVKPSRSKPAPNPPKTARSTSSELMPALGGQPERAAGAIRQDHRDRQAGLRNRSQQRPGTRDKDSEAHPLNLVRPPAGHAVAGPPDGARLGRRPSESQWPEPVGRCRVTLASTAMAVGVVQPSPRTISTIFSPHSVGFCATWTPAADSASILACAVPWEPEMMAPAWPILRPGGAVTPAM